MVDVIRMGTILLDPRFTDYSTKKKPLLPISMARSLLPPSQMMANVGCTVLNQIPLLPFLHGNDSKGKRDDVNLMYKFLRDRMRYRVDTPTKISKTGGMRQDLVQHLMVKMSVKKVSEILHANISKLTRPLGLVYGVGNQVRLLCAYPEYLDGNTLTPGGVRILYCSYLSLSSFAQKSCMNIYNISHMASLSYASIRRKTTIVESPEDLLGTLYFEPTNQLSLIPSK